MKKDHVATLGSTGKKAPKETSGDIDLALDVTRILENNKISKSSELFKFVLEKAKKFGSVKPSEGFGVMSLAWPITNTDGEQKGQSVQLDLMLVDSLDLAKFTFWSPSHEQSKWKGVYRNMMLSAIASHMDFKTLEVGFDESGEEIPVKFERNFVDLRRGLIRGLQTRIGATGKLLSKGRKKTLSTTVVSDQPVEIIRMMLGPDFSVNDAVSFESLLKILDHPKFLYKSKKKDILKTMVKTIKNANVVLPKELEKFA
ncbi:MAG: hypothetical protein ACE5SV_09010 [Candidatus Nitrosomaritimum aestuariumsis]